MRSNRKWKSFVLGKLRWLLVGCVRWLFCRIPSSVYGSSCGANRTKRENDFESALFSAPDRWDRSGCSSLNCTIFWRPKGKARIPPKCRSRLRLLCSITICIHCRSCEAWNMKYQNVLNRSDQARTNAIAISLLISDFEFYRQCRTSRVNERWSSDHFIGLFFIYSSGFLCVYINFIPLQHLHTKCRISDSASRTFNNNKLHKIVLLRRV